MGLLLPSSPQTRVLCRPGSLQDRGSHSPASRNVGSCRRPTTESFSANCPWKLLLGASTPDGCSLQGYNGLLPRPGSCHLGRAIPTRGSREIFCSPLLCSQVRAHLLPLGLTGAASWGSPLQSPCSLQSSESWSQTQHSGFQHPEQLFLHLRALQANLPCPRGRVSSQPLPLLRCCPYCCQGCLLALWTLQSPYLSFLEALFSPFPNPPCPFFLFSILCRFQDGGLFPQPGEAQSSYHARLIVQH